MKELINFIIIFLKNYTKLSQHGIFEHKHVILISLMNVLVFAVCKYILVFGDNSCNSKINSNIVKIVTLTTNESPTTSSTTKYFKIETSTNELPLSDIDFSLNPLTPDIIVFDNSHIEDSHMPTSGFLLPEQHHKISPLATNERPLSCTCLAALIPEENSFSALNNPIESDLSYNSQASSANLEALSNLSASAPSLVVLTEISDAEVRDLHLTAAIKGYALSNIPYIKPLTILRRRSQSQENLLNEQNTNLNDNKIIDHNAIQCTCVTSSFRSSSKAYVQQSSSKTNTLTHYINKNDKLKSFKHTNNKQSSETATVTSAASSSSSTSSRRQRHSIAGQMSYMKMLGFGGFGRKSANSTNSLFSTAVISGSSSAPNLRDMIPTSATVSGKSLNPMEQSD